MSIPVTAAKTFSYKGRMCHVGARFTMTEPDLTAYERRGLVTRDQPTPSDLEPQPKAAAPPDPTPTTPPSEVEEASSPALVDVATPSTEPQPDGEQELPQASPAEPMTTESLRRTRRRTERA